MHVLLCYTLIMILCYYIEVECIGEKLYGSSSSREASHLNRFVRGDEGKHEVETRTTGGGQESPSPYTHTHTQNHYITLETILITCGKKRLKIKSKTFSSLLNQFNGTEYDIIFTGEFLFTINQLVQFCTIHRAFRAWILIITRVTKMKAADAKTSKKFYYG